MGNQVSLLGMPKLHIKQNWFQILALVAAMVIFFFASFTNAFFWTIFLVWLAFRLDSRIVAGVAIAFLLFIPGLLAFGQEVRAEQFAVYVFFLLVITVALQIVEFWRDRGVVEVGVPAEVVEPEEAVEDSEEVVALVPPRPRKTMDGIRPRRY